MFRLKLLSLPICLGVMTPGYAQEAVDVNAMTTESILDLQKVFSGSPVIYIILLILSTIALMIALHGLISYRNKTIVPSGLFEIVMGQVKEKRFEAAIMTCNENTSALAHILARALPLRNQGYEVVNDSVQLEGKKYGSKLWQYISILGDIVTIAPMLGLLGTVLGMFYAFYDINRSMESMLTIFDGLGIAIGTTVAGLIVSITAMIFQTVLKHHFTNLLNQLEQNSVDIVTALTLNNATHKS